MPHFESHRPSRELTDEQIDAEFTTMVAHFNDTPEAADHKKRSPETISRRNILDDILADDDDEDIILEKPDERPLLSEMDRYESSISKGLDWTAEKLDGGRDRFTGITSRLDDLAYRVDTEGKKELVPGFLRMLGRIALGGLRVGRS